MSMLSTQAVSQIRLKKSSAKMNCRALSRTLLSFNSYHVFLIGPSVIRGKIEEISLPDGVEHVDIIISEWMGYALLYESMLDSVLHARDKFLRPNGGVMAPSQCRMMLALCDGNEVVKDRVAFWNDVYGTPFFGYTSAHADPRPGFDLSEMAHSIHKDAIIDVVSPESVVSEPYLLKVRIISCRPLSSRP